MGMRKNLDSLTGLRGVAAFVVFLAHFEIHKSIPFLASFTSFFTWHNAAVDLFFVLSGFTLAYVYSDRRFDAEVCKKYLIARVARIYPLYLLSLLGGSYLVYQKLSEHYGFYDFCLDCLRQLFLVNCWGVIGNGTFFNHPAWSISVEMFCYIFLFPPLAVFYSNGKFRRPRVPVIVAPLLMVGSYFVYRGYYRADLLLYGSHPNVVPFSYYVNVLRGIIGFFVGYVLHFSYKNRDRLFLRCSRYPDFVYGAALLPMLGQQLHLGMNTHMLVILSPFLCLACAGGGGWVNRALASKPLVHLGDISYSVYLLHFLVIQFASLWFHQVSRSPILVPVVYMLSVLTFYLYEKPLRGLINRMYDSCRSETSGCAGFVGTSQDVQGR